MRDYHDTKYLDKIKIIEDIFFLITKMKFSLLLISTRSLNLVSKGKSASLLSFDSVSSPSYLTNQAVCEIHSKMSSLSLRSGGQLMYISLSLSVVSMIFFF